MSSHSWGEELITDACTKDLQHGDYFGTFDNLNILEIEHIKGDQYAVTYSEYGTVRRWTGDAFTVWGTPGNPLHRPNRMSEQELAELVNEAVTELQSWKRA